MSDNLASYIDLNNIDFLNRDFHSDNGLIVSALLKIHEISSWRMIAHSPLEMIIYNKT